MDVLSSHQYLPQKVERSHLALKRGYELSILREDGEVEVVVVVCDRDLPRPVDPNPDRIVCDPWVFFSLVYRENGGN